MTKQAGQLTEGKRHAYVLMYGKLVRKPINKDHWNKPK